MLSASSGYSVFGLRNQFGKGLVPLGVDDQIGQNAGRNAELQQIDKCLFSLSAPRAWGGGSGSPVCSGYRTVVRSRFLDSNAEE